MATPLIDGIYSAAAASHWLMLSMAVEKFTVFVASCRGVEGQRCRNGGGDGGARPRNVETAGARVSFRPRNISPHFCMLFLKFPLLVVMLPTYN